MKRIFLLSIACLLLLPSFADSRKKKLSGGAIASPAAAEQPQGEEIRWMSMDDVQVAMKKEPRQVWLDVYTDWCVWCKRMDKTTFSNPHVIRYMNEHFYAVKLNAEQQGDIRFMGKFYPASPAVRTHPFATALLGDKITYPTTVVMGENFQTPQPIPGFLDLKTAEMVMKYFGEGLYKTTPWNVYQAEFKPAWL